jgi:DNA-binding GntR family transcriptional regulator
MRDDRRIPPAMQLVSFRCLEQGLARKPATPSDDSLAQDSAVDFLRQGILRGEFGPGIRVPHAEVARRLGVSGVPVREAMQLLAGEGHLIYVPHKGYYVPELSREQLIEIYDIRAVLESDGVRSSPRHSPERVERLQELIDVMDSAAVSGEMVERGRANREFHFLLSHLPERPLLHRLVSNLWDATNPYRAAYLDDREHVDRTNEDHRRMRDAAADGETELLIDLLDAHRREALERLLSLVDRQRA